MTKQQAIAKAKRKAQEQEQEYIVFYNDDYQRFEVCSYDWYLRTGNIEESEVVFISPDEYYQLGVKRW